MVFDYKDELKNKEHCLKIVWTIYPFSSIREKEGKND